MKVKKGKRIIMRKIKTSQIKDKVKELFLKANYHIDSDLIQRLEKALKDETSPIGKSVLQMIIENNKITSFEKIAICQDTDWLSSLSN